jgi:hypothetical protein
MSSDLTKLQRIKDIPDNAVRELELDGKTFEVKSTTGNKEILYFVFYSTGLNAWTCTCKDFIFRNTEETPDYECKHIGKVRDLLIRRIQK